MKEMIRYGAILGIICIVASGVLSVVNAVTEPQIKIQKDKEENAALSELMPEVKHFEPVMKEDALVYYKAFGNDGWLSGFIIKCAGKGYSSTIEAMAALNLSLEITAIKVLSANETPGLGSRISESFFLSQFSGKGLSGLGEVQAITGATISSSALIDAVKNNLSLLSGELQQEINNAR